MIKVKLHRIAEIENACLGILYVGNTFFCYSLENNTRKIPFGVFKLKLTDTGEMNEKYKEKYASFHKGMIEIDHVPGRVALFFHIGNTTEDAKGCILVGNTQSSNGFISNSQDAYKSFYPRIADALASGEQVCLNVC